MTGGQVWESGSKGGARPDGRGRAEGQASSVRINMAWSRIVLGTNCTGHESYWARIVLGRYSIRFVRRSMTRTQHEERSRSTARQGHEETAGPRGARPRAQQVHARHRFDSTDAKRRQTPADGRRVQRTSAPLNGVSQIFERCTKTHDFVFIFQQNLLENSLLTNFCYNSEFS
jgi:hypothetical protein